MEAIKKKLANLKEEKESAYEKADEAEAKKKEAESRADAVRVLWVGGWVSQHSFCGSLYGCGLGLTCLGVLLNGSLETAPERVGRPSIQSHIQSHGQ